jgi:hypothetical protein
MKRILFLITLWLLRSSSAGAIANELVDHSDDLFW